eukprot:10873154-Alexandrium_andersonii.AAC.1
MSASLVGSEMCIRDSGEGALSALRNPHQAGAHAVRASNACRRRACSGIAVSYTHLTLPTICSV